MIRSGLFLCGGISLSWAGYSHFLEENPLTHERQFILWRASFDLKIGKVVSEARKKELLRTKAVEAKTAENHKVVVAIATELLKRLPSSPARDWNVTVVKDSAPNAYAVPDGSIFVTTGLISLAETPDELALVLAHEVGHVYLRHSAHQMSTMASIGLALGIAQFLLFGDNLRLVEIAQELVLRLPMSRRHELEADKFGIQMMVDTGFDNNKGPIIIGKLKKLEGRAVPWLSTHPASDERVKEMKLEIMRRKDVEEPMEMTERREKLQYVDKLLNAAHSQNEHTSENSGLDL